MRKTRFGKKMPAVVMGMITMAAVAVSKEAALKVQAAELPVVKELEVAASPDNTGVIARCSYQNHTDQSGCEMRLYLYKVETDGELIEAQKVLTYAEWGSESTEPIQVTEGVYRASVSIDNGVEIKQINSQNFYRVKQVDGNYQVTEETETANGPMMGAGDRQEKGIGLTCSHIYEDRLVQQATPVRDAVQAFQCEKCGAVREYVEVPNSAYAAFLKEAQELIQNAPQGETVMISTERWMSFSRKVLETIKIRPDITVMINYQYQGEEYSLIIPAGTDIDLLIDESGFRGFRSMEEILTCWD